LIDQKLVFPLPKFSVSVEQLSQILESDCQDPGSNFVLVTLVLFVCLMALKFSFKDLVAWLAYVCVLASPELLTPVLAAAIFYLGFDPLCYAISSTAGRVENIGLLPAKK
jgi:hypothetical protein